MEDACASVIVAVASRRVPSVWHGGIKHPSSNETWGNETWVQWSRCELGVVCGSITRNVHRCGEANIAAQSCHREIFHWSYRMICPVIMESIGGRCRSHAVALNMASFEDGCWSSDKKGILGLFLNNYKKKFNEKENKVESDPKKVDLWFSFSSETFFSKIFLIIFHTNQF